MSSKSKYKAIRGMGDSLPVENRLWRAVEDKIIKILESYSYQEIRLPIMEQSDVFNRSIGESTDIVQKEMYSFPDRNGESMTLRPEGTAGCVRAAIENNLINTKSPQRLWYHGPMFRYERPQRGRQRQFHQIGLELFGSNTIHAESELILIFANIWKELGLKSINLEVNSLGTKDDRLRYRKSLTEFLSQYNDIFDDHNRQKLKANPLRLLDSKEPKIQEVIVNAPSIADHLSDEAKERFAELKELLYSAQIDFRENEQLVRGLDYYSDIVFEWTTSSLGSQNAVCAGGRYDGLVEQLGGKATAAVGCAVGLERILEMCKLQDSVIIKRPRKMYVLATELNFQRHALLQAEELRQLFPEICFELDLGSGSLKSKMKKADKSGADAAIIIGNEEIQTKMLSIKALRKPVEQKSCRISEFENLLPTLLV